MRDNPEGGDSPTSTRKAWKVSLLMWLWLLRSSKIRIPVALLGFWILFVGCQRVRHPALIMVQPKAAAAATHSDPHFQPVVMTTSKVSCVRGVLELFVGAGLLLYISWPMRWMLVRRA